MNAQTLHAETAVALGAPSEVMAKLREHFGEHGSVEQVNAGWRVVFAIGTATATELPGALRVRVEAGDESSLALLQWSVAEHLLQFASGDAPKIAWTGGVTIGSPPPYFRAMRVTAARQITPRMRRLTLAGENLERFAHGGLHVRLLLPPRPGVTPVWPVTGADGRQAWPEGARPVARVYTIRHIDVAAGTIDVDFVLHAGDAMPGATFGLDARPGDVVGMTGPGGNETPQADCVLLAGDETALPAIARMLEEMPEGRKVTALIEVADNAERQDLATRADLDLHWLSREGRPAGTTTLLQDAVLATDIPGEGRDVYAWAGCEHAAARTIRRHWRRQCGLNRDRHLAAAYWRSGMEGEKGIHD